MRHKPRKSWSINANRAKDRKRIASAKAKDENIIEEYESEIRINLTRSRKAA